MEPLGTDFEEVPWRRNNWFLYKKKVVKKRDRNQPAGGRLGVTKRMVSDVKNNAW